MAIEREIKFMGIDIPTMRVRLEKIGATCIVPDRLMRRTIFDFPDHRLGERHAWARVRDEGDRVTMSYKRLASIGLEGMEEVEFTIPRFEDGEAFLQGLGLVPRSVQESRRETWVWHDCEIVLDTWPWLPSFMEIEGSNEDEMRKLAQFLNLSWEEGIYGGIVEAFKHYYDVTSDEINHTDRITFEPVPAWLEAKKR
jgi:adenylate cyclase class 2